MNSTSWHGIRAFIDVAEHGSFTAAAKVSKSSKGNLSQLVTELEKSLRVQLLHRTTRKLQLTEIGEGYYERCKRAMVMIDSAAEWASQSTDELSGLIRMNSVGGLFGEELVVPLIMSFMQHYPEVDIQLDFSSTRVDLIESHYDLVLRMGKLPDSTLIARTLCTVTTRYVASPDFLKEHGNIRKPEDLKKLPLIYGSVDHWEMKRGKESRVIHVDKGRKAVTGRVMRQAALAGLGVTRLADVYCQSDIDKGTLVEVLPAWSEETPISLVSPPVKHQLQRVRKLRQWIADHFDANYQKVMRFGAPLDN